MSNRVLRNAAGGVRDHQHVDGRLPVSFATPGTGSGLHVDSSAHVISQLTDVSMTGSGHAAPVIERSSRAMKNATSGVSRMRSVLRAGLRGGGGRSSSAHRVVMCEALWSRSGYTAVDVSHMTVQVGPFGPVVAATGRTPVANGAGMLTGSSHGGHVRYLPPIEYRNARLDL